MALEPINCTARSREIEAEYLKVVRGSDETTTWLIIGPNESKEYGPEATGNNFSDFLQSFDDTKVQYGLARVSPPGSDVYKLILIGWCPDSASMKSRASFASNFAVVANNVLKGYHVQVTARDEDDLNEQELLARISNASGARYSIQSEFKSKMDSSTNGPSIVKKKFSNSNHLENGISSNIKKGEEKMSAFVPPSKVTSTANATKLNTVEDDNDDWDEPEIEERDLDKNPLKPNPSTYKPIGKVNLQDVITEEKNKQDPRIVKNVSVKGTDNDFKINPSEDIAKLKAQSKLQRDYEIDSFLKNPTFKQQHDDKVIKGFQNEKSPAQLWAEKKAKETETTTHESAFTSSPASEVDTEKHNDIKDLRTKFEQLNTEESGSEPKIIQPQRFVPPVAESNNTPNVSSGGKPDLKTIGTPLPGMYSKELENDTKSDKEEEEEEDWSEEEQDLPKRQPISLSPRNISNTHEVEEEKPQQQRYKQELMKDEEKIKNEQEESEPTQAPTLPARNTVPERNDDMAPPLPSRNIAPEPIEEDKEDTYIPPPPPRRSVAPEPEPEEEEETAPWAVAEYDYEAGEDNELTFEEGDKIINIDFVDDDWWLGELEKTGEKGLFPSNYVSLQGN